MTSADVELSVILFVAGMGSGGSSMRGVLYTTGTGVEDEQLITSMALVNNRI